MFDRTGMAGAWPQLSLGTYVRNTPIRIDNVIAGACALVAAHREALAHIFWQRLQKEACPSTPSPRRLRCHTRLHHAAHDLGERCEVIVWESPESKCLGCSVHQVLEQQPGKRTSECWLSVVCTGEGGSYI